MLIGKHTVYNALGGRGCFIKVSVPLKFAATQPEIV